MKKDKFFAKIFFTTLLLGAVVGFGFVSCTFLGMTTFDTDFDIDAFNLAYTTTIVSVDENGEEKVIEKIYDENRQWVDYENIPQSLKDAVVCIEDERFYYHNGVDFIGTTKAVANFVAGKKDAPGGSTITQQLVKNLTDDREKAWQRKVTEILRAMNVENKSSKEDILEMYLNTVYFGNGSYGVKSAAKTYFDKLPIDLTPLECASIAGLTQSPERYNPFKEECKDAFTQRRNAVLDKMLEFEKISQAEYDEYISSETPFISNPQKDGGGADGSSYFIQKLLEDAKYDLQQKYKMSRSEAEDYLRTGGLKIYATMDENVQKSIDAVYKARKADSPNDPQSAIVILDPYTGGIKGMAGGFGTSASITRNRVYDDPRQPGSAIKPIAVYAPAIEMGILTPTTIVDDSPYKVSNSLTIKNYDGTYSGKITARYALQRSKNPTAVRILDELGLSTSYNFLQKNLGITTLDERDKGLSPLALGGLTYGLRVDEITAAYAPFVNGGTYYTPHTYTHIVDASGAVILDNRTDGQRAMDETTAYIMNSLLQSVVNSPNGTAYGTRAKVSGVETGGKTGTTDDDADRWFVGITPKYVGAVWYGYDDRRTVYAGGNPSVQLWGSVMEKVYSHEDSAEKSRKFFDGKSASGIKEVWICAASGMLPGEECPKTKANYADNALPVSLCIMHTSAPDETEEGTDENGLPVEDESGDETASASGGTPSPSPTGSNSSANPPSPSTEPSAQN